MKSLHFKKVTKWEETGLKGTPKSKDGKLEGMERGKLSNVAMKLAKNLLFLKFSMERYILFVKGQIIMTEIHR